LGLPILNCFTASATACPSSAACTSPKYRAGVWPK
jgi:hypothetical protein